MDDRELLELAAKAAGLTTKHKWNAERLLLNPPVLALVVFRDGELLNTAWNPLENDGHALRLAVKLRMTVTVDAYGYTICEACIFDDGIFVAETEYHNDTDDQAATRRAIVCAAAGIGRAMP